MLGYHTAAVEDLGFPGFEELVLRVAGCTSAECNQTVEAVHVVVEAFPVAWHIARKSSNMLIFVRSMIPFALVAGIIP